MTGPRHSIVRGEKISYSLYLVLDARGHARMTREEPSLKQGERSMKLNIEVPRAIFQTPALVGSIKITDDQARDKIIADISTNAARVLKEHCGLELALKVEEQ